MAQVTYLHDPDLSPKLLQAPSGLDDDMLANIDACILIVRDGDTPQAKHAYRLYLKHRSILQTAGMTGLPMREEAFFRAMEETGATFAHRPLGRGKG